MITSNAIEDHRSTKVLITTNAENDGISRKDDISLEKCNGLLQNSSIRRIPLHILSLI